MHNTIGNLTQKSIHTEGSFLPLAAAGSADRRRPLRSGSAVCERTGEMTSGYGDSYQTLAANQGPDHRTCYHIKLIEPGAWRAVTRGRIVANELRRQNCYFHWKPSSGVAKSTRCSID